MKYAENMNDKYSVQKFTSMSTSGVDYGIPSWCLCGPTDYHDGRGMPSPAAYCSVFRDEQDRRRT